MDRFTREGWTYESWLAESVQRSRWESCRDGAATLDSGPMPLDEHRDAETHERLGWLVSTIEAEIIPRLMLAHRGQNRELPIAAAARRRPGRGEVESFARRVLAGDAGSLRAQVEALRDDGVELSSIYLELLAPAASHLGDLWAADLCDFTEVTTGLWRLHQLMYDLSPAFQSDGPVVTHARRALLAPVPGSQHTFGLLMVAEFFQRAGWDVWTEPSMSQARLVEAVRTEWFDVIGLSVGSEGQLDAATSAIAAIRRASLNPSIGVLVGGAAIAGHPEHAAQVGADSTAIDAPDAVRQAEGLLGAGQRQAQRARG